MLRWEERSLWPAGRCSVGRVGPDAGGHLASPARRCAPRCVPNQRQSTVGVLQPPPAREDTAESDVLPLIPSLESHLLKGRGGGGSHRELRCSCCSLGSRKALGHFSVVWGGVGWREHTTPARSASPCQRRGWPGKEKRTSQAAACKARGSAPRVGL